MMNSEGTYKESALLQVGLQPTPEWCDHAHIQHIEMMGRRTLPRVLLNPSDFKKSHFVAGQLLRVVVNSAFSFPSVVVAWPSSRVKAASSVIISGRERAELRQQHVVDICLQPVSRVLSAIKIEVEIIETNQEKNKGFVMQPVVQTHFRRIIHSALRGMVVAQCDIHRIIVDNHSVCFCIKSLLTSKEAKSNRPVDLARVTTQTCVVFQSQSRTNGIIECKLPDNEERANLACAYSTDVQPAIGMLLIAAPGVSKRQTRTITQNMHLVCKPSEKGLFKLMAERAHCNDPIRYHSYKQLGITVLNVRQVAGIAALGIAEAHLTLRALFLHASARASTIIILEELETLSMSIFSQVIDILVSCFDNLNSGIILAPCGHAAAMIFPALRQSGRFDRTHTVELADTEHLDRIKIMLKNVTQSNEFSEYLHKIAIEITSSTNRRVIADFKLIGKISLLCALKNSARACSIESFRLYWRNLNCTKFGSRHVLEARSEVLSRYRSQIEQNVSPVHWADLGGLKTVKRMLCEIFQGSLLHASTLSQLGIESSTCGVLLYGPPGCSKTMLARAIATESSMNFLTVLGPELLSMWLGDSERALHAVFLKARAMSPAIIFFDEIDSLALRRTNNALPSESAATDRVLAQLLVELDGIASQARICVVAATNRPDLLDPALMRPGRLDYLLYIPPPDLLSRCEILVSSLKRMPIALSCDNFIILQLARCTALCSGAEIVDICRRAALDAIGDTVVTTQQHGIEPHHLYSNLAKLDLSSRSASLLFYEIWQHRIIL
jgi:SpoVK/Ycf46/Vps4 family AAA+-type ATPase